MQKSVKDVGVALVVVAVLVGLAGVPSALAADEEPVSKPASIEAYERLVAELEGRPMDPPTRPIFKPFPEDAKDIVEGYDRLFERMQPLVDVFETKAGVDLAEAPHKWTDGDKAKIAEFLETNKDLLSELRRLTERGAPVYPLDFSQGFAMLLPHLAQSRQCSRALRASAVLKGTKGDYAGAVEDIIAGMKLGDALAREPILISQLVRIAVYGIMGSALENSFEGSDLSPELTRRLMTQLAQADHRDDFAGTFAGEMYFGLKAFSAIRAGDRTGLGAEFDFGPPEEADEKAYVEILTRIGSAARLPYYEAAREIGQIQSDIENMPQTLRYSRGLLPALGRTCEAQARHEAIIDLMQMGILVEQYKARNGSYPDSLDDIASGLGGSVPVDPFSGKSYLYKPLGTAFVLYSIGHNRIDDGGTHDYMKGDIVWRGEAKK